MNQEEVSQWEIRLALFCARRSAARMGSRAQFESRHGGSFWGYILLSGVESPPPAP